MDLLKSLASSHVVMIVGGALAAVTAVVALIWSKHPFRWLLGLATLALAYIALVFPSREREIQFPRAFDEHFRLWLFALGVVVLYATSHLVATLVRHYRVPKADAAGAEGGFPDLDAAWQEILVQLSQARIDPASQRLFLLLAPNEALAASLVEAAGLPLFVRAPAGPEAPIHAYATSDTLLLSCGGANSLGRQGRSGTARLEHVCRLVARLAPERPPLRGVAVVLPMEWGPGPETSPEVTGLRDDLQSVRAAFQVQSPTYLVMVPQGATHGFDEFAARMPANLRQGRCGFSVPASRPFGGEVLRQGLGWLIQWFQSWSLNLMVQDIGDRDSNGRLLRMVASLRRDKPRLIGMLESALTIHRQAEPVLFRGVYLASCGPDPASRAFAAGLLLGPRGRLPADHALAVHSREAASLDRSYRRGAWAVGLATASACLPIWLVGIRGELEDAQMPGLTWAGLGLLAVIWVAGLGVAALRARKAAAA